MKKHTLILALCALFITPFAYAGCQMLHIQLSNISKKDCTLTSKQLVYGNEFNSPPHDIPASNSKPYDLGQSVYGGPTVNLTYTCGKKKITLHSQQNMCFASSGPIHTSILYADEGISAVAKTHEGSTFWDRPGTITWIINVQDDDDEEKDGADTQPSK